MPLRYGFLIETGVLPAGDGTRREPLDGYFTPQLLCSMRAIGRMRGDEEEKSLLTIEHMFVFYATLFPVRVLLMDGGHVWARAKATKMKMCTVETGVFKSWNASRSISIAI